MTRKDRRSKATVSTVVCRYISTAHGNCAWARPPEWTNGSRLVMREIERVWPVSQLMQFVLTARLRSRRSRSTRGAACAPARGRNGPWLYAASCSGAWREARWSGRSFEAWDLRGRVSAQVSASVVSELGAVAAPCAISSDDASVGRLRCLLKVSRVGALRAEPWDAIRGTMARLVQLRWKAAGQPSQQMSSPARPQRKQASSFRSFCKAAQQSSQTNGHDIIQII